MRRRQFLQTAGATLSSLGLSSCGWTLASVSDAPVTTGDPNTLYIYTWAGYTDDDLLARFEAETGYRAIADVFDSNEAMLARIQASGGGGYSILYPSDYMVQKMKALGMLLPLERSRIFGLDRLFERFHNPQYDPDNRYSIPVSWGTTGLIYNPRKLGESPQDWDYLWENRDQIAKRFTLLNDVREVFGAILKSLGNSYNTTDPERIRQAYEKLQQIKSAIASFTSDAWRNQILTGDLWLAMCYSADANEVMRENSDLHYVLPLSGSCIATDTLVIPRTAPNPDAAYAWINFMLQPDVAAQICQRLSFATPNEVAFGQLPATLQQNTSLFPPDPAIGRCEEIAPVGDDVGAVYDRYWTLLTSS
ncbi:MAG: spermidine/putrescine ABC transporter substrate-binding protein [Jaaginema sp. PMC 1080.18]|nr:spermidine/putrescine ABC transporter substrate-binding protein [Jaaginema sp. PMC 1080.18]MEC4867898.1 spermidine/putrescine ABC transporter substrate-binding protein [Jaaginema sp. PMC 1078.18]